VAITFVKHIGNGTSLGAITVPTGGVAVGDLLVLRCHSYSGGGAPTWGVTDTKGNTWVATCSQLSALGTTYAQMFHCFVTSALVATTDSITLGSSTALTVAIDQFTGVGTTHSSPAGTASGSNTTVTVSKTPASSGSLIVGFYGAQDATGLATADSDTLEGSWSTLTSLSNGSRRNQAQYKVVTGTSAQTYNPVKAGYSDWYAVLAAFPEGGGGAATSILPRRVARSTRAILQAR
jgi:hypothetical protein